MVWSNKILQFLQYFLSLCLQRLIKDDLTLAGRLDEVAGQLRRLFRLDTKPLKLASELVDGDFSAGIEVVGVKEERSHLICHQLLLL